jgi:orotate phosphoribosyltransferase
VTKPDEIRNTALKKLQEFGVLMLDGHFDFGNGYHGRVYLNPHQLFCQPSIIWRFAQDLIDVLPAELLGQTDVVAGPVTGGALLAHTVAGLLDSRRALSRPPMLFAPFRPEGSGSHGVTPFYAQQIKGRRVLLVDDVRNTGQTLMRCAELVRATGGSVVATAQIYDRMEAVFDAGVPNIALAEYKAPENHEASSCPLCRDGVPITAF